MESDNFNRYKWWDFIEIGYAIRYMEDAHSETPIDPDKDDLGILYYIDLFKRILDNQTNLDLYETYRVADHGLRAIEELLDERKCGDNDNLGNAYARVRSVAHGIRVKLEEETGKRSLFPAIPASHLPVERLIHDPESYFGIHNEDDLKIPRHSLKDFSDAGICLAIDLPAPAIIFAYRGTEALVWAFYKAVLENDPPEDPKWHDLIQKMIASKKIDRDITDKLDEMRKGRNRAMHSNPRAQEEWNVNSALDIIANCKEVILRMCEHLQTKNLVFEGVNNE